MATIAQTNQDDEEKQGPQTVAGTGGAGSNGTGASGQTSQVQQNVAPQNNQGYTDVASYLNANKGGSEKLGQQVSTNLGNKYNATKSGLDSSYQSFSGQVAQGGVPENSDLISQVASDPTAAAQNNGTLEQFQKQLNAKYTGPTEWGDYGTQMGKVNEANQYADLAKTPGGLNTYTREVEAQTGRGQSQGINSLDTLLLGGNSNAVSNVRAAADPYKGLNDYINQQNMAGAEAIGGAQTAAQNTAQHALDAFTGENGTLTRLNADVNTQASTAKNQAMSQQQALQDAIKGLYTQPVDNKRTTINTYGKGQSTQGFNTTKYNVGDLAPENLAALGIDQNQWNALRGAMQAAGTSDYMTAPNFGVGSQTNQIDLSQWLSSRDPNSITAANTATADQYAKTAAIQKLLGDKTPQGSALNPALASLAGTAPTSLNDFNYDNALGYTNQLESASKKDAQNMANTIAGNAELAHAEGMHGGFLDTMKDYANLNFPYTVNKQLFDAVKK